jgi:hypothetical protein
VQFSMTIQVMELANQHLAVTKLGGIVVKSPPCPTAEEAVRQLFATITNDGRDGALGISLALQGTTLEQALEGLPALEEGSDNA